MAVRPNDQAILNAVKNKYGVPLWTNKNALGDMSLLQHYTFEMFKEYPESVKKLAPHVVVDRISALYDKSKEVLKKVRKFFEDYIHKHKTSKPTRLQLKLREASRPVLLALPRYMHESVDQLYGKIMSQYQSGLSPAEKETVSEGLQTVPKHNPMDAWKQYVNANAPEYISDKEPSVPKPKKEVKHKLSSMVGRMTERYQKKVAEGKITPKVIKPRKRKNKNTSNEGENNERPIQRMADAQPRRKRARKTEEEKAIAGLMGMQVVRQSRSPRSRMSDEERREKRRAARKAYSEKNLDKVKAWRRAYRQKNKAKINEAAKLRRMRKAGKAVTI